MALLAAPPALIAVTLAEQAIIGLVRIEFTASMASAAASMALIPK